MNTSHRLIAGTIVVAGFTAGVAAQNAPSTSSGQAGPDWPQWRGPRRDGTLTAFTEPKAWPDTLTQRWKITVGEGYATPILVGNRIYQFSRQGGERSDARDRCGERKSDLGDELRGAVRDEHQARSVMARDRSRRRRSRTAGLFTLGMSSIVTALDAATGKELWRKPGRPAAAAASTRRCRRSSTATDDSARRRRQRRAR